MSDILSRVRTGDWLDQQTFPALRWAVPGIVPEGFGLFTGAPKTGKSWAAFGIALAIASGGRALDKIETGAERPVLMLALEDGDRRLQGRARHLLGPGVPIPAQLHYLTSARVEEVPLVIEEWLAIHGERSPLVVLDTLGKIMPPALPGEGAYARDYRIGSRLKALVDEHPGACLLAVHHTRKLGSDDWMDSTSGTNGLNGAADFTASLARNRNDSSGVLRVTGRDVPEGEYAVTSDNGRWSLDGGTIADAANRAANLRASDGLGDRSAEIVALVNAASRGVRAADVVAQVQGIPDEKSAGTYLARLANDGRIARESRGVYVPLESVESVDRAALFHTSNTFQACSACGDELAFDDGTGRHATCEAAA